MKKLFDFLLALILISLLSFSILFLVLLVRLTSPGPAIYWSKRVGLDNRIFKMPKLRTMQIKTPEVATHELKNPDQWLTPIGSTLRKTSLDELPQLWCILKGEMSFVGPRPALFNQYELIQLRTEMGVHELTPGLTGWAQINGRDELTVSEKVQMDVEYLEHKNFLFDLKIIGITVLKVIWKKGVLH